MSQGRSAPARMLRRRRLLCDSDKTLELDLEVEQCLSGRALDNAIYQEPHAGFRLGTKVEKATRISSRRQHSGRKRSTLDFGNVERIFGFPRKRPFFQFRLPGWYRDGRHLRGGKRNNGLPAARHKLHFERRQIKCFFPAIFYDNEHGQYIVLIEVHFLTEHWGSRILGAEELGPNHNRVVLLMRVLVRRARPEWAIRKRGRSQRYTQKRK
jgi:hypothetical protein